MKTRIVMVGSKGRMGQAILRLARENELYAIAGEIDQGDDLASVLPGCDVVIDFSHHTATVGNAELTARAGKPFVIGTTGHTDEERERILAFGKQIPLILSPNYSVGVNTLFWLTRKAAEILGPSFDLEVVEMHHNKKKDAPSGTARRLAEILCEVRDLQYNNDLRHGRVGVVGERTRREIGMHALRGGDVVGDHTVVYATEGERVELTHKASSRDTFASGALRAARWLCGKPAGVYDMFDILGLK
jgi:4-hydroxy-tetrahydrodipicolinate reductase